MLDSTGCPDGWAHDDWVRFPLPLTDDRPLRTDCSLNIAAYNAVAGTLAALHCLVALSSLFFVKRTRNKLQTRNMICNFLAGVSWAVFSFSAHWSSFDGYRGVPTSLLFLFLGAPFFAATSMISAFMYLSASIKIARMEKNELLKDKFVLITGGIGQVLFFLQMGALAWFIFLGYDQPGWGSLKIPTNKRFAYVLTTAGMGIGFAVSIAQTYYVLTMIINSMTRIEAAAAMSQGSNPNSAFKAALSKFRNFRFTTLVCAPIAVGIWTSHSFLLPMYWWAFQFHSLNVLMMCTGILLSAPKKASKAAGVADSSAASTAPLSTAAVSHK